MALAKFTDFMTAGSVTNSHLAGSINASKLAGSIPVGKMDLSGTWNFTGDLQHNSTNVSAYDFGTPGSPDVSATGDASTTNYDLSAASPVSLSVYVDKCLQTLTTNYSFNPTGGTGGVGRVTMSAAPASGSLVEIYATYAV